MPQIAPDAKRRPLRFAAIALAAVIVAIPGPSWAGDTDELDVEIVIPAFSTQASPSASSTGADPDAPSRTDGPPAPATSTAGGGQGGSMPRTGAQILTPLLLAALAIGLGTLSRRRAARAGGATARRRA
ncbi:MAG: hypothetical protein LBD97_00980 [Bifidobacteriaceae bacterium]|jgi:hypothetical protein|nr:hypothetical protein [Bifidobacteriaceae bacterium]